MNTFAIFDMRKGGLGPEGEKLDRELMKSSNDRFAYNTGRQAAAILLKVNVPTLRQAIIIRKDGKFVPVFFLAPPEDWYEVHLIDKGAFPLKGT